MLSLLDAMPEYIKSSNLHKKKQKQNNNDWTFYFKLFQDSRLCFRKIVEIERLLSLTAILS